MKKHICFLLLSFFATTVFASPIALNSEKGQALFQQSHYKGDFFLTGRFYNTQQYATFCGVASAAMVLNALGLEAPLTPMLAPYRQFTQENIFTAQVIAHGITPAKVMAHGLQLNELQKLLSSFNLNANLYSLNEKSNYKKFKKTFIPAIKNKKQLIIGNFYRPAIGQVGGGHFSPVVAYNDKKESVLILDVASYRYPPVWVPLKTLYKAMHTKDGAHYRGYLIVGK